MAGEFITHIKYIRHTFKSMISSDKIIQIYISKRKSEKIIMTSTFIKYPHRVLINTDLAHYISMHEIFFIKT